MKIEIDGVITEAEVVIDRGGVLVYRTPDGRMVQGTYFDGRRGGDMVGATLNSVKLYSLDEKGGAWTVADS